MSGADLALAVERHATSKLDTGDLTRIDTLGFRGEALPSIGSVARLDIVTRARAEPSGHRITVDAGSRSAVSPAGRSPGTTIEVRDLFGATPARLKFLKTDRAEAQAVAQVVKRLAMAHPDIRFSLGGDHLSGFDLLPCGTGPEGRLGRLAQIIGEDFAADALPLDAERETVRLSGFAGLPTFHRGNRDSQYLFVNGRPVRDKVLVGAIAGAYADHMMRDRFPVVALFVDCDPRFVDINVHPAKAEVRFRDPGLVRGLIIGGVREAIATAQHRATGTGGARMGEAFGRPQPTQTSRAGPARWDARLSPSAPPGRHGFSEAAQAELGTRAGHLTDAVPFFAPDARADPAEASGGAPDTAPLGAARAQLHETYIVAQTRDGIVIVDQHAAHERLVYERMKSARAISGIVAQSLLVPEIVALDEPARGDLLEAAALLEPLGLALEAFGPGAVAVRAVPAELGQCDIGGLVRGVADLLAEGLQAGPLERPRRLRLCKAAAGLADGGQ